MFTEDECAEHNRPTTWYCHSCGTWTQTDMLIVKCMMVDAKYDYKHYYNTVPLCPKCERPVWEKMCDDQKCWGLCTPQITVKEPKPYGDFRDKRAWLRAIASLQPGIVAERYIVVEDYEVRGATRKALQKRRQERAELLAAVIKNDQLWTLKREQEREQKARAVVTQILDDVSEPQVLTRKRLYEDVRKKYLAYKSNPTESALSAWESAKAAYRKV